jgi:hypothetical protein
MLVNEIREVVGVDYDIEEEFSKINSVKYPSEWNSIEKRINDYKS